MTDVFQGQLFYYSKITLYRGEEEGEMILTVLDNLFLDIKNLFGAW